MSLISSWQFTGISTSSWRIRKLIVRTIIGLFQLAVGIMQGLLLFLYGFIDGGARFDEWAQHVLDGIANLPNALGALITSWVHEFEIASTDRQIIMIGELTGQVLALIATFEFAAGRAGSLPRVAIALGEGGAPRDFFRQRGFADIDEFCVELEEAEHQAVHGGGNWRLGRTWPNEWNQRIMRELAEAEGYVGRPLTRSEIITIGRELMVEYGIDESWISYR